MQETQIKIEQNPRISNRFSAEQLAVLQMAAAENGIVGSYAIAKYIRQAVKEKVARDGKKWPADQPQEA